MLKSAVKAIVVGKAQLEGIAVCGSFAKCPCGCIPDTGEGVQPALCGAGWRSDDRDRKGFAIDGVFCKLYRSKVCRVICEVVVARGIEHVTHPWDGVIRG